MLRNALSRYTSSPPAGGAVSLRLGQARVLVPTGNQFNTAPLLRSPQGEAKVGVVPRGSPNKHFFTRIRKLSPLCTTSLLFVSPGLPVPWGVSGGGAALSPGFQLNLCPPEQHGAHFAAQSPERSFFFPLFLSRRKKKRLLAATQSQNLCHQIKKTAHTGRHQ